MMKRMFLFSVMLSLVFVLPAYSQDKAQIEAIIKEYIQNHPQEIVDSVQKFGQEQRKKAEEEAFKQSLLERVEVPLDGSPMTGPQDAPITIVEFSDFQCPFCARTVGMIHEVTEKYKGKIKMVYKFFPLAMHDRAKIAGKAALAAGEQGKFWEYHDVLLGKQQEWGAAPEPNKVFIQIAKDMGLDTAKFEKDMGKPEYDKRITDDMALGHKIEVSATPTFVINGVKLRGPRDAEMFIRVIEAVQAKK